VYRAALFLYIVAFSLLLVETADRPGLLIDLVKIISDNSVTVQSGEFDTEVKFAFPTAFYLKPFFSGVLTFLDLIGVTG
jgi:hypothetical protein